MSRTLSRLVSGMLAAFAAILPAAAHAQEALGQPVDGQLGFQQAATPIMESMHAFHNGLLMWIISAIVVLVLALLIWIIIRFNHKRNPKPDNVTHNTLIEVVWTVFPVLVLIVIAIPSFGVLSDQETIPDGERAYLAGNIFSGGDVVIPAPSITIKATGYQWYWGYEYMDEGVNITQIMLNDEQRLERKPDEPRLLAVDNEVIVPVDTTVRVQVTAGDVLHSFAIPSFGIKVDAVPGRLNETWFHATREGIYYGQCSELCGKDHAFMPIAFRVVSQEVYDTWMQAATEGSVRNAYLTLASAQ